MRSRRPSSTVPASCAARMYAPHAAWFVAACTVLALWAGCGSGGGHPTAKATPTPTPTRLPALAAMPLAERGVATSVNHNGWITWRYDTPTSRIGYVSGVTWAPDAPQPDVPLPVLPCDGLPPEACFHQLDTLLEVADGISVYGDHVAFGSGGPFIPLPALFGPERSYVLLIDPEHPPLDLSTVASFEGHLCETGFVVGTLALREDVAAPPVPRPVVWTSEAEPMVRLPSGAAGAFAKGCDAALRVAGRTGAPSRAVVWQSRFALDAGWHWEEVLLPLDGADSSAALAIDERQVVGWRGDTARSTAVAWQETSDGYVASVLPDLPDARCERATATSTTRIAGDCGAHGVAWDRTADAIDWSVVSELLPLPGDARVGVVAMSLDLAVGWSGDGEDDPDRRPVAWRLPPH